MRVYIFQLYKNRKMRHAIYMNFAKACLANPSKQSKQSKDAIAIGMSKIFFYLAELIFYAHLTSNYLLDKVIEDLDLLMVL